MSRYGFLAAALAAGAAAQAAATPDPATGITFATYKEETTGARFGLVVPQTFTGDFIGQMIAPTGNSTGWVGMSLGPSMLNNLLVTAWPNEQEIVSSFRMATGYAPPAPFPAGNITATPISAGTFVNSTHYAYTFLCTGCLSVQANWQGDVPGTGIGWALSTNELGNTASANATLNFHNAGQGIFILSLADAQSADFAKYAALAGSGSTPTDPDAGNGDGSDDGSGETPGEGDGSETPGEGDGSETPGEGDGSETPGDGSETPGDGSETPGDGSGSPAPTGAPFPTTTFDPIPTGTAPTGEAPRPTRRPRPSESRSTKTKSTKTSWRRNGVKRAAAAPFRPAFNPEAASSSDFEEAQRFKASFLDGYYKRSE